MGYWPLAGVQVVDATLGTAGPLCGKILADAGATVTSVDFDFIDADTQRRPSPDWVRFLDRGKHVSGIHADDPTGRARVEGLLDGAAVYLCSHRHDQLVPVGLDCGAVIERHPDLLAVCVTPFGHDGPYSSYLSDDVVLSALSGLTDCTPGFPDRQDGPGEPPVQSVAPLAEVGAGVVSAVAVMGALLKRLRGDKEPRHIEISCHEANAWLMVSEWGIASYGGSAPGRTRKSRSLEPNCYLRCADGYVVIVATTDKHWRGLVAAMGNPEWGGDDRFSDVPGRAANAVALHEHLENWASTADGREFMVAAQERGIPCTCFLELRDVVAGDQVAECGSIDTIPGIPLPADPIVFDGERRVGPPVREQPRQPTGTSPASGEPPLAGIRVLDLGQMVAGPMAGQYLAALGAEVIVVESGSHLPSRQFGPFAGEPQHDASSNFNHCNRGKASVTINLTETEGREVLSRLISTADVVLENFSPRAAKRLGLTYADLRADRDDIILASISAFGRSGPQGEYVSHHGGVTALSGLASAILDEHGDPHLVGGIYPDVLTGTYMALGIQQALALREQTGRGCHIQVSMLDVLLTCMAGLIPAAAAGAKCSPHPARFLRTAEQNRFIALADADPVDPLALAEVSRAGAMSTLQAAGHRAGAVLDMLEVMQDPHLRRRGFVLELDHPVAGRKPLPAVPWFYDGERPTLGVAPLLGQDTEETLATLGLARERVAALVSEGVLR